MIRWVISPVIIDGNTRRAKVFTLPDLGRPPVTGLDGEGFPITAQPTYIGSAAISDGAAGQVKVWCLCFVRGVDPASMNADPTIVNVLERDYDDAVETLLNKTPRAEGWKQPKLTTLKSKLSAKGVVVADITLDTPFWEILQRLGRVVNFAFRPKGTWVARSPGT